MERVKLSFKELWKAFTQNDVTGYDSKEEIDIKKVIQEDESLSEQDKKVLLNSIENTNKMEKNIFKESLSVKKEKQKNTVNKSTSKIPVNTLSNEELAKIAEEKAQKVKEDMGLDR